MLGIEERTPGASKQHKLDTDEVLWHDWVPVVEHPELMRFARSNNCEVGSFGEKNGVASAMAARLETTTEKNIFVDELQPQGKEQRYGTRLREGEDVTLYFTSPILNNEIEGGVLTWKQHGIIDHVVTRRLAPRPTTNEHSIRCA